MNSIAVTEGRTVQRPALEDALRQLYILGGIDMDGHITDMGRRMAALPVEPSSLQRPSSPGTGTQPDGHPGAVSLCRCSIRTTAFASERLAAQGERQHWCCPQAELRLKLVLYLHGNQKGHVIAQGPTAGATWG